jgi:hypothetical protein
MFSYGYGANHYAGIYPDMGMARRIYGLDGMSEGGRSTLRAVLDGIVEAVVKFDVGEFLSDLVNN